MALRQRGKNNYWHAYFRRVVALPDGRLKYSTVTVNLGTADLIEARALEAELMRKNREARLHQRYLARMARMDAEATADPNAPAPEYRPVREHKRKRLKLAEWRTAAEKYRRISEDTARIFNRFVKGVPVRYFDEVTPEIALRYLQQAYGGDGKGKSFNNNKTALNSVFRFLLVDAGLSISPFAAIPNRQHTAQHQRPFTEDEFKRIYRAAPEPWKTACVIAWYTGMREETVFNLKWSDIEGDVVTKKPGKTARYGRAVEVPFHPEVLKRLAQLPHVNDYVLGWPPAKRNNGAFMTQFGKVLDSLGIVDDARGIVNFNCFRNSFITTCDREGLPRHATRGVVGQRSDEITDLYSHDLTTARRIQSFPTVDLDTLE